MEKIHNSSSSCCRSYDSKSCLRLFVSVFLLSCLACAYLEFRSWRVAFRNSQEYPTEGRKQEPILTTRRQLGDGPGSYPPRCASKCGACTPCKPVHVPVPPGTPVIAEYYPEAWRCKCGNKLYMP